MDPEQFREWRTAMTMTQQQAAEALGLSKSTIENYESGKRRDNDQPVEIPKVVALACAALQRDVGGDPGLEQRVQRWHDAAAARYEGLLLPSTAGVFLAQNHFQLSYGLAHSEGQEIDGSQLINALHDMNEEVRDRVRTGWSMFYPFSRDEIRPRTTVDPNSGKGDDDFIECSVIDASMTGATDYWRVSRDGFASVMRGYFEDRPETSSYFNTEPGSFLSPNWMIRDLGEIVRHAQAFAARLTDTTTISFRCTYRGLSSRNVYDPRALWLPTKFDPDAAVRTSSGTWSAPDLKEKWPAIVAKLAAPMMRAGGIAHVVTPDWVKGQAGNWRML
jgi:hypothetical protein